MKRHEQLTKYKQILESLGYEVYPVSAIALDDYDRVTICCKIKNPRKAYYNYEVRVYDDHVTVIDIYTTMYKQMMGDIPYTPMYVERR